MSRLKKFAKISDLMNVKIGYGNETFKFNLYNETRIDVDSLNKELNDQPSSYSFLLMLHKKLIKVKSTKEVLKDRAYAKAFVLHKTSIDESTNRTMSKEVAKEKAQINKEFMDSQEELIQAIHDCNIIEACVKAFEQRKDILQTLSANHRNERV